MADLDAAFICIQCDMGFPSVEELDAHEKSGHATKGKSLKSTPPPPMNQNFEQTMAEIAEDKKQKEAEMKRLQQAHEKKSEVTQEKKPLRLEYKYTGNCECGSEPLTIVTDTPGGMYAVDFCMAENRQIESIQVERLEQPKKMKIEKKEEAVEAEIVEDFIKENAIMKKKGKRGIRSKT